MIRASVVLATYNRPEPLKRLLATLVEQTIPKEEYEVVVIDDGSVEDATEHVKEFFDQFQLVVQRQDNTGVALARQHGVERAQGRIIIFLDDDMLAQPTFIEEHLRAHGDADDLVVMGELLPVPELDSLPLFERFHAHQLTKMAEQFLERGTFGGQNVYTGNLSLSREMFFRAGGFDPAFHIEDVELGVRLEKAGARFLFSREVATIHASDHTKLSTWLARSIKDGRDWVKLERKHPDFPNASPWGFLRSANPVARAMFSTVVAAPKSAPKLAKLTWKVAASADRLGLDRVTAKVMTLLYGIQFFEGVREETGSLRGSWRGYVSSKKHTSR